MDSLDEASDPIVKAYDALRAFHSFIFGSPATVQTVLEDPELYDKVKNIIIIFDYLLSNQDYTRVTDHPDPDHEKLLRESACFYEWTIKLFLSIFSRLNPYKNIQVIEDLRQRIAEFLLHIQTRDSLLFGYFVEQLVDLLNTLPNAYKDEKRLKKRYDLPQLSSQHLYLVEYKINMTDRDVFEPDIKIDFFLESSEQLESLFINCCKLVDSLGKPFVQSYGASKYCRLLWSLYQNCVSFGSTSMIKASMRLFLNRYPKKVIQLHPAKGFFKYLLWLTCYNFKSTCKMIDSDLYSLINDGWIIIAERLRMEKNACTCSPIKILRYVISLISNLPSNSYIIKTDLINIIIPQVLLILFELIEEKKLKLPDDDFKKIFKIFTSNFSFSLPFNTHWIFVIKVLFLHDNSFVTSDESFSIRNGFTVDREPEDELVVSQPTFQCLSSDGRSLLDELITDNSKSINKFLSSKDDLTKIARLHNMLYVEYEVIMTAKIIRARFPSSYNLNRFVDVATKISEILKRTLVSTETLKYCYHLLIIAIKVCKELKTPGFKDAQDKISTAMFIPFHGHDDEPRELQFNLFIWDNETNVPVDSELRCLSLQGLSLLSYRVCNKFRYNIVLKGLIEWEGCEQVFNKTLSYFLSNETVVKHSQKLLEKKDNEIFIARCLGVLTCFLSNSTKKLALSLCGDYSTCDLISVCEECAEEKAYGRSSIHEHVIRKILDIFKELLDTLDPVIISSLSKWSSSRVIRHCGVEQSILKSIFRLFSSDSKEVKRSLQDYLVPLLIKAYQKDETFSKTTLEKLFLSIGTRKVGDQTSMSQELAIIENVALLASYLDVQELPPLLVILCRKSWTNLKLQELAKKKVNEIAKSKALNARSLFRQFKEDICLRLAHVVMDEIVPNDESSGMSCLRIALSIFVDDTTEKNILEDFDEMAELVTQSLEVFFAIIVERSDNVARALLNNIIDNCHHLHCEKLTEHYNGFLARILVRMKDPERISQSLEFLKEINKQPLKKLLGNEFEYSVLLECHHNKTNAGYIVQKIYRSWNVPVSWINYFDNDLKSSIEQDLGGILITVNRAILRQGDPEVKAQKLESLRILLDILESAKVTSYKMNIMGVLVTAFNKANGNKRMLEALFRVWSKFLELCDPSVIGPHLAVICKDLVPFYKIAPSQTVELLEDLICKNEDIFRPYLKHLHFLLDLPLLDAKSCIDGELWYLSTASDPVESLKCAIRKMSDELLVIDNPDVKLKHAEKLKNILNEKKYALLTLCLPNKEFSTDPSVTLLIKKLLHDSSANVQSLSIQISECLGEIGAIDPGRLDLSLLSSRSGSSEGQEVFISRENLPVQLLTKLASTLDSIDESRIRDCLSYAIQESLKHFGIAEKSKEIWSSLRSEVQMSINPFFSSKYTTKQTAEPEFSSPVFDPESDYESWIYRWLIVLIKRIKDQTLQRVFESCSTIMRYHSNLCRFLLPTIFWNALQDSTEQDVDNFIVSEVNAILYVSFMDDVSINTSQRILTSTKERQHRLIEEADQVRYRCARTVFSVIDSVARWESEKFSVDERLDNGHRKAREKVKYFLSKLDKCDLAELAFKCQAYARAIRFMEEYIREKPHTLQTKLELFQKYYVALGEADAVEGFDTIRERSPSLIDTILNHEANNQFHYSFICCGVAIKRDPDDIRPHKTMLESFMSLNQQSIAFNIAKGLDQTQTDWKKEVYPYMVEAAWKLNDWNNLSDLLAQNFDGNCDSFEIGVGNLFKCIISKDREKFEKISKELRLKEMDPLTALPQEQGAYIRGYQHILRLHMINDIEKFHQFIFPYELNSHSADSNEKIAKYKTLSNSWKKRNELVQSSLKFKEPLLNLQRAILSLPSARFDSLMAQELLVEKAWLLLSSAKLARKSKNSLRAYSHLIEVQDLINTSQGLPSDLTYRFTIEKAKYEWDSFENNHESRKNCVKELSRALDRYTAGSFDDDYTKIKLLHAKFSEELSCLDSESMRRMYEDLTSIRPQWEESNFCLAKYLDRLFKNLSLQTESLEKPQMMVKIVQHYGTSLKYGCKHVYESMPRLLSLWCDCGVKVNEFASLARNRKSVNHQASQNLFMAYQNSCEELTKFMDDLLKSLAPHLFYTAFSQLISRICHSNRLVSEKLVDIIAKLVTNYPNQCMWGLVGSLLNTSDLSRSEQCRRIINKAVDFDINLSQFTKHVELFAKQLLNLCNYEHKKNAPGGGKNFKLSTTMPKLMNLMNDQSFSRIMLPYQDLMTVRMIAKQENENSFSPFPKNQVFIEGFVDRVDILVSQARPKKVGIKCSDGKTYTVMCKPKDDLRKDARTMEFNNLINRLLKRDPETRKRQLNIRTYTVVPLCQAGGLVEWINDLSTFRELMRKSWKYKYPERSLVPPSEMQENWPDKNTPPQKAAEIFKKGLENFPPVAPVWFAQKFPDPTSWYMARLSFIKSTAVMSMVGYIIGLGDRHMENILLDSISGDLIHVDFNMLFNQGEALNVPERVPFRLTHNMVAAMGVTGYEGIFRRTCEATLAVLRAKKDALMSVLTPFVYDPLLEWRDSPNFQTRGQNQSRIRISERESRSSGPEQAYESINRIQKRLIGIIDNKMSTPISVSGQVQFLIEEATDPANLGRMYWGWTPYL